tara:strand:+ start:1189 stop:1812 length:624 start_codon:yes stop_codon:yes gene_type:complete
MARSARRSDGLNKNFSAVAAASNQRLNDNLNRFRTGDHRGLTLSTKTDAECDTGFTMATDTYYNAKWVGDAACAIVLPEAKPGAYCVFRISAACDGGQNLTFTCAGTDKYAAHTIQIPVTDLGDGLVAARTRNLPTDFTQDVAVTGGSIESGDAADTVLTITATATNNQTAIGAEFAFYCEDDGFWFYSFLGSELGNGAKNTNWATS